MRRRRFAAALLTALATSGLLVPAATAEPAGPPVTGYTVSGLDRPVRMVVDRWGVPHIYARSREDAFLAQGFNAARDRLFQIDLFRRRGLGKLAEVLGPDYVEQDRATRLFLYRGDMSEEWASYGPQAKRIATEFTDGINAYVDYLAEHPDAMPPEFRKLGYKPSRWAPEDVVRIRSHGLTRNVTSEVERARVACAAGVRTDRVRQGLQPEHTPAVPDGVDPCAIPEDVLDTFDLATENVEFSGGRISTAAPRREPSTEGSNNWVVSPGRTSTGRPLLANDPHRAYSTPSLRYISHLSAPGMNVIGANEPSLPGVSIGHNEDIAFGLTIFPIDQEDLYVYRLNPDNPGEYRYRGGWEPMRTIREPVPVKGGGQRSATMRFTRHGPVVKIDRRNNRAYAVRTAWNQPGMAPYFGSIKYMLSHDYKSFVDAMRGWGAPTENQVYADADGNTAWVPGGLAPRRTRQGYDGLLPVPGDGRYEWDGFYDGDDLPRKLNPEQGYFATNNQYNLPAGYPATRRKLGFEWTNPFRHRRTNELLAADDRVSVADAGRFQNDQLSIPARRITALLRGLRGSDARSAAALDLLRGWDHVEHADSPAAALFEVWASRHLAPAFVRAVAPKAAEAIEEPDTLVMIDALEHPARWFGRDAAAERDALLVETLGAAWRDMTRLLGADSSTWRWGALQKTALEHPMSPVLSESERARFDAGRLPRGGSSDTINQSSYDSETFEQTNGPSFRMVLDVGNWDASRAVNTPGQSGNPDDPHYRDLAATWQHGKYFPLAYSREAVERNADRVILLLPRR